MTVVVTDVSTRGCADRPFGEASFAVAVLLLDAAYFGDLHAIALECAWRTARLQACGAVSLSLRQAVTVVTRILVITSCTGDKAVVGRPGLQLSDFQDPERLERGERILRDLMRPAGLMYTGQQHICAMNGVRLLRGTLGPGAVRICVFSAGYGVIDEDRLIAPYDVTFSGMPRPEARRWARQIGASDGIRKRLPLHDLVIVLLSRLYLDAVDPPLPVADGQRVIYFAREAVRGRLTRTGSVLIPAGAAESGQYRMGLIEAYSGHPVEVQANYR